LTVKKLYYHKYFTTIFQIIRNRLL